MYLLGGVADYILTAILDELACRELEQVETVSNRGSDQPKRKEGKGKRKGKMPFVRCLVHMPTCLILMPTSPNPQPIQDRNLKGHYHG